MKSIRTSCCVILGLALCANWGAEGSRRKNRLSHFKQVVFYDQHQLTVVKPGDVEKKRSEKRGHLVIKSNLPGTTADSLSKVLSSAGTGDHLQPEKIRQNGGEISESQSLPATPIISPDGEISGGALHPSVSENSIKISKDYTTIYNNLLSDEFKRTSHFVLFDAKHSLEAFNQTEGCDWEDFSSFFDDQAKWSLLKHVGEVFPTEDPTHYMFDGL